MEPQPSVKLLTIKEAAQLTRLHPNTIRNLIQRNELKADRIGRSIRINEQQLLSLLTPYEGGEFGVWKKSAIGN
jgi:excisionase family DNA binding protein